MFHIMNGLGGGGGVKVMLKYKIRLSMFGINSDSLVQVRLQLVNTYFASAYQFIFSETASFPKRSTFPKALETMTHL
jgi:hypothetical protein